MKDDIKVIHEKFMQLISDKNLLELQVEGVKIWQYSQFEIFNLILSKKGIFDNAHDVINLKDIIKSIPSVIYNSIFKSALHSKMDSDVLIFNHPRKMLIDNEYVDIYTKYYISQLECKYQIIEKPYMNQHYKDMYYKNTKYLDDLKLASRILTRIKRISLNNEDLSIIEDINNEIETIFGIKINLSSIFRRNIIRFKANFMYYDKLLKKVNPKVILLVVSYSYMELIYAAKINNIETIEIQHGVITKYSIPYSYKNNDRILEYFPDKVLLFGDYWKKDIRYPLPETSLISSGFPFLEHQIEKYSRITKDEKKILFVSQGTIGKELFKMAIIVASTLYDFEVIFKLHPGEYAYWKEKYDSNNVSIRLPNFKIVDTNKENIYSLFTKCNIVIGVYSTAIYEALAFNCKCILVNLPGIEYMESLIDESEVFISNDHKEIIDTIKQIYDKNYKVSPNYFFKMNSYRTVIKNIVNLD